MKKTTDHLGNVTRSGTTPGGRNYTSTRTKQGNSSTTVRSGQTKWHSDSSRAGGQKTSAKRREVGSNPIVGGPQTVYHGVKGPTKVKKGFGKTESFPDGGKIRQGTTPGGRKYRSVKQPGGFHTTTVGGYRKESHPSLGTRKMSTSKNLWGNGPNFRKHSRPDKIDTLTRPKK